MTDQESADILHKGNQEFMNHIDRLRAMSENVTQMDIDRYLHLLGENEALKLEVDRLKAENARLRGQK